MSAPVGRRTAARGSISELGLNSSVELSMRYGVIYADPPWRFGTYSAKGTGRGAISHYDVMTVDELGAMPVAEWSPRLRAAIVGSRSPHLARA
jgi:hypothetical protein